AAPVKDGLMQPAPMWYSRTRGSATGFEPQRAIGQRIKGMDGDTIAADDRGNVYIAWHAMGDVEGEAHRRVYLAQSRDDGAHFDLHRALTETGRAGGCRWLRAGGHSPAWLDVLYPGGPDPRHPPAHWAS